jgi:tetraacyldisaccharide 4'-kinase
VRLSAPDFWSEATPTLAARLLSPLGLLVGAVTARRMRRPGWRAPCPVICVGNLTVGGTGKTPTALAVAARLQAMGERPAFLTRGHGGAGHQRPLLVDLARHDASVTGDEARLLARCAPTVIAPDRAAGARLALDHGASVLVMDDGLQNPTLAKDLSLAVIDGGAGFGNGLVLPAGPLRASVAAQAPFVDAVLLIGEGAAGETAAAALRGKPVLRAGLAPDPGIAARLAGMKVLAMAGIGRPAKFGATLTACGAEIAATRFIGDHAPWSAAALAEIATTAAREGLSVVTTEKDRARIGEALPPALAARLIVLPVTLAPDDEAAFTGLLREALSRRRGGAGVDAS